MSANALVAQSANAEASSIAVGFMVVSFVFQIRNNRTITNKTFVSCRFAWIPEKPPRALMADYAFRQSALGLQRRPRHTS
jgi:hypothetical protein